MGEKLNKPSGGEEPSKKRCLRLFFSSAKGLIKSWFEGLEAQWQPKKYLKNPYELARPLIFCSPFWVVSWVVAKYFPQFIATHRFFTVAYGLLFVFTLSVLLRRIPALIRCMFDVDDGELIGFVKNHRQIRTSMELCEQNFSYLLKQPPAIRNEEFERIVNETSLDISAQARHAYISHSPLPLLIVIAHLGLVALTFASAELIVQCQCHSLAGNKIFECPAEMPVTLLGKLLLYSTVSFDHMGLGNLRTFAMPWPAELVVVAEVSIGLWIVLLLAPMVFAEATAVRELLEDRTRVELELKNYWSIKYGISR